MAPTFKSRFAQPSNLLPIPSAKLTKREITNRPVHEIAAMGLVHVPEGRKLFTDMTILENLELGAYLRDDKAQIKADIEAAYERSRDLGQ